MEQVEEEVLIEEEKEVSLIEEKKEVLIEEEKEVSLIEEKEEVLNEKIISINKEENKVVFNEELFFNNSEKSEEKSVKNTQKSEVFCNEDTTGLIGLIGYGLIGGFAVYGTYKFGQYLGKKLKKTEEIEESEDESEDYY